MLELPPPAPSFVPNVPAFMSTVMPTSAPNVTGDGGVAPDTPDLYQQFLLCHFMSFGTGRQPGRPLEISGISPVSDVAPYTSKGLSRDKSPDVGTTCVSGPTPVTARQLRQNSIPGPYLLKSPKLFGRGSNGTGNNNKS